MSVELNPGLSKGWICFHCWEFFPPTFAGQRDAQRHFGGSITTQAACLTKQEKGILLALREAEDLLARYQEEDTDLHRSLARLASEHGEALRREEEKGYARGLEDARAEAKRTGRPIEIGGLGSDFG